MQASFADLVGTAVVTAHCFDTDELTELTPALDTVTAVRDMEAQASEATITMLLGCVPSLLACETSDDMAAQASEGKATVIVCTVTFCPF